jgi:hypothetical protein
MPKDNEARAREVLAAIVEADEAANGARSTSPLGKSTAYYIRDGQGASITAWAAIRAMLAYQSEAPAQGMSGDLHAILAGAHKVATGQVNDNGYEIKQRLDTVHRILEQALSRPLADREAIAREGRLRMFLEILSAMGGSSDASESEYLWINAFCEAHEGAAPDTFNIADARGLTWVTHNTDTDHSVVTLTDAGRAWLSLPPSPVGEGKCTCAEIHGEDPNCALHGDKTQWGIENAECWNCGVPVNRPVGEGIAAPAPVRGE